MTNGHWLSVEDNSKFFVACIFFLSNTVHFFRSHKVHSTWKVYHSNLISHSRVLVTLLCCSMIVLYDWLAFCHVNYENHLLNTTMLVWTSLNYSVVHFAKAQAIIIFLQCPRQQCILIMQTHTILDFSFPHSNVFVH